MTDAEYRTVRPAEGVSPQVATEAAVAEVYMAQMR